MFNFAANVGININDAEDMVVVINKLISTAFAGGNQTIGAAQNSASKTVVTSVTPNGQAIEVNGGDEIKAVIQHSAGAARSLDFVDGRTQLQITQIE